jgi:hypothetical protein
MLSIYLLKFFEIFKDIKKSLETFICLLETTCQVNLAQVTSQLGRLKWAKEKFSFNNTLIIVYEDRAKLLSEKLMPISK